MTNYVQKGDTITVTLSGTQAAGDAILVGAILAVLSNGGVNGDTVSACVEGVFSLPKTTGQTYVQGDALYWNNSTKKVTNVVGTNRAIGFAWAAAGTSDTTCIVNLEPTSTPGDAEIPVAENVAELTENSGAIGGTNDGNLPDLTPTAVNIDNGSIIGTGNTALELVGPTNSGDASGAIMNNFKDLQGAVNALIVDNAALRAAIRENATTINALIEKLVDAGLMEAP